MLRNNPTVMNSFRRQLQTESISVPAFLEDLVDEELRNEVTEIIVPDDIRLTGEIPGFIGDFTNLTRLYEQLYSLLLFQ